MLLRDKIAGIRMKLQRGKPDKTIHEADRIVWEIFSGLTIFFPGYFWQIRTLRLYQPPRLQPDNEYSWMAREPMYRSSAFQAFLTPTFPNRQTLFHPGSHEISSRNSASSGRRDQYTVDHQNRDEPLFSMERRPRHWQIWGDSRTWPYLKI